MGGQEQLLCAAVLALFFQGISISGNAASGNVCQNCIHLDFTMILGISAASLLATIFLAIAVYHIAVEERGRPTQASDKQCLLANDQLYQPLQEHNDRPYSHIGIAKPRRR
ncbi:T-cell surface glycoprotein CD3 delta chain-like isoform X5 [Crotalus tigris]|uniref:T-cell surface glycoprotein CD3 delta chain-like isoform X5 n=1 Tax=Crotalus tigris TaxID=88082 RepID=UPI00192F9A2B|nr:T-cell surface glycoprotein CD3 delta chain-like isoform X5 [Crotalus tigris]